MCTRCRGSHHLRVRIDAFSGHFTYRSDSGGLLQTALPYPMPIFYMIRTEKLQYFQQFDIYSQLFTGQGVVCVEYYSLFRDLKHRNQI
jgi:hypothetical protein